MTNYVGTSSKQRNQVLHLGLHHFNPPSQWKAQKTMEILGREGMCAQKDKGMQTQACMNGETITIVYFLSNVLLLQCNEEAQYISLQYPLKG